MKKSKKSGLIRPAGMGLQDWKGKHLAALVFLSLATALAYSNSLHGTWALDDTVIGQYASVENVLNFRIGYRKVANLTFLFNKWIDPVDPANYRVFNIALHVINSILVYMLAFVTLRLPGWRGKYWAYSFPVALLSGAVFALHPININAVSYIVQRLTSLATMFVLLGLLSYITARTSESRYRSLSLYLLSGFCIVAGIFSKENAVLAMPLILLYELVFLSRPKTGSVLNIFAGISAGLLLLGLVSVFLEFHGTVSPIFNMLLHGNEPVPKLSWTAVDAYWTPFQHILTQFRVIGRYLFLLILPLPGFLVFDWWGFRVSAGILDPATTLISIAVISGIIGFSFYKRRELPFLFFGVIWYFLAISLESFIAIGSDLYFEHRNYLPLAGLVFGVTAQALIFIDSSRLKEKQVWIMVFVLAGVLGLLTFQRNFVWKDSATLWQDTLRKTPGNLRAVMSLGNAYLKESDMESAENYYKTAMEMSGSGERSRFFQDSIYSLGMVYLFMGDLDSAKKVIETMDAKLERSHTGDILKAFYNALDGDLDEAISQYKKILPETTWTDRVVVLTLLGDAYRKKSMPELALESYKKAIEIDPTFSAAYYGMGDTYLSMRDLNKAVYYIEKTLKLDPSSPLGLAEMADILLITKAPPEKAMSYADRALVHSPPFYQPYLAKANILIVAGEEDAAGEFYEKAREKGLEDYMVPFSKARAYYLRGETDKARVFLEEVASMENVPENVRKVVEVSLTGR
jgi:tetratricopeptide (TPR) repeat protein